VKAGVISQALQRRAATMSGQPGAAEPTAGAPGALLPWPTAPVRVESPFASHAALNAAVGPGPASTTAPTAPAPQADIFSGYSPQLRALIGVNTEQPMLNPRTGETGISRDYGTTLENGAPAAGFMPTTQQGALKQERDNNTRTFAAQPLPPAPTGYSQYEADAAKTSGLKSLGQGLLNDTAGIFGAGEVGASYNRARENLINTAQSVRQLVESAPGVRAAVAREKLADKSLPQPNLLGVTGINADEQKNRAVSTTQHLRDLYGLVQQDAMDVNTPPEERVKMVAWMHNMGHAITQMEAPAAGPEPAQPSQRQAAVPAGPQQPQIPGYTPPAAPQGRGQGPLFQQAREAIARGADPEMVKQRLKQNGVNPEGL
jgi:hypothetical protein